MKRQRMCNYQVNVSKLLTLTVIIALCSQYCYAKFFVVLNAGCTEVFVDTADFKTFEPVNIPMELFKVNEQLWYEDMVFAVRLTVYFSGKIKEYKLQALNEISRVVRPDSIWKQCADSVHAAIRKWSFYDVTAPGYRGPLTREYLQRAADCPYDDEVSFFDLLAPYNKNVFKYDLYFTVVICITNCKYPVGGFTVITKLPGL